MRISDWSSDVCSSDLGDRQGQRDRRQRTKARQGTDEGADRDADETEQQVLQTKRRLQPHGQIGQKLHHHCNPIDLRGTPSPQMNTADPKMAMKTASPTSGQYDRRRSPRPLTRTSATVAGMKPTRSASKAKARMPTLVASNGRMGILKGLKLPVWTR